MISTSLRCARTTGLALALALVVSGVAASAQAAVVFPAPGRMQFSDLPAQVPAGHTFTLREVMPYAIFGAELALQRRSPTGAWQTLVAAPPRPHVVWLHWRVPATWHGAQMTVRFVMTERGGQVLAVSGLYAMGVSG